MSLAGENENGDRILRQLSDLIEKECSKTSFACGGEIAVSKGAYVSNKAQAQSTNPINLYWASPKDDELRKLTLPELNATGESTVEQLAADCTLASFGRGSEDVVDTEYRHAGKLDTTHFASTFHPADFGLIENIEQILLAELGKKAKDATCSRKLVPDLYKLNVYSGPSGIFKKHVDTPRGPNQIISLVVCLPSAFEGGSLLVRHRKQEINFDWSSASKLNIQWAAFYSDCEHEIETVTEGHRITLTYNLHVVDIVGGVIRSPTTIVDPESLAPYELIKSLLEQSDFMPEGGKLGVWCSHAYAHASADAACRLPRNLKGSDLVIYSIFKHLGYEVAIRPVLRINFDDEDDYQSDEEIEGDSTDTRETKKNETEKKLARKQVYEGNADLVGKNLRPSVYDVDGVEESKFDIAWDNWPSRAIPGIVWLRKPKHREMAINYLAYGNESTCEYMYSYAAILIVIPPWNDDLRGQFKRRKKN